MSKNIKFYLQLSLLAMVIPIKSEQDTNPDLALNYFMQGEFLMSQGNYALAILEFQEAIALDPNVSTIHVAIADGFSRIGKLKRSETHLKIAIELDPNETEGLDMLGQIYFSQKKYNDAQQVYKRLHSTDPDNLDYIFTIADLYRAQKNWDLSIDYYILAYDVNTLAIKGLEQALQIALSTSKLKRAEEICELMHNDAPDDIDILNTYKDLTLYNQNYKKSLSLLEKIEKQSGITNKSLLQKSALYEELDQKELALETALIAHKNDSLNIETLQRIVSILMDQSQNEEAIKYNKKLTDNHPNDPRGFINNAVMAMNSKKPDQAIDALQPYADKFATDFTMQYLLGTAYYQTKDYDNAERYLAQALEIYPQSRNTKHNLALIYDSMGEWTLSDQLYIELIESDSTDAQAFNNYAYSLVERNKDIDFALELAQYAISIEPKSAAYLDTIGWIYFKLNYYDEALRYIKQSLTIDSENSTIQGHLNQIIKVKAQNNTSKVQQVKKID